MCRLDLVTVAVLLLPYYYVSIVTEVQAIPTDDTTKNAYEMYDLANSDENTHEIIKQTLTAYQDLVLTNGREYYVPESVITVSSKDSDVIDDEDDEPEITNEEPVNEDVDDVVLDEQETNTSTTDYHTTVILDQNTSDILNDLIGKNLDESVNSSKPNEKDDSLTASKHAKMFIPSYDTAEIQLMPVYLQNQIQTEALNLKNDTLDFSDSEEDIDNETQTTVMVVKKPTTTTTIPSLTAQTTAAVSTTATTIVTAAATATTITTTRKPISTTAAMHIYKFSADEILRKFLEDSYIRSPLAALIDTSPDCLRKSKRLWKAALRPNAAVDIVLVTYNSSGVGVTYSFKNTRTMEAGLDSIQESSGLENGGNAFYGIVRASELVPYDSAIFISTDSIPLDTNLAQYAAITLLKKRIRLYLIWFGPQAIDDNETQGQNTEGGILGEVALRSGGEILRVTEEESGPNGDLGLITLYLSNDIQGAHELDIPIDTTVSNLQINIQGNVETATLDTTVGG